MGTKACIALPMLLACLSVRADETSGTSDTELQGSRTQVFRDVGPRRSVLIGVEVYFGKFINNDVIHGVRPIFLDAQGREQLGGMHGKDTGRPPVRVKAKKGYAVGAISVKTGMGIDGLSVTFMKLSKGRVDPEQSYDSDWLGGNGGGEPARLGGSGDPVVGLYGSQNNNSELNGLGLVLSKKPISSGPQKKAPLPPEAAQAKALKLAKEVYGDQWAAAKTPAQKRDLAQKLLRAADESENDPAGRYVLLRLGRDIATQAAAGLVAFEAIDDMAEQFQIDDVEMKTNVLTAFSKKKAKSQADHKSIADQAVGLIDGAIAHDNIDLAVKLCELALPEARASRDADLVHEVKSRSEQCRLLGKAYREMKEAAAVLDKTPDDAAANLAVGRYYCFQKGDWEKGLPMLALGKNEPLKAVAAQEIAGAGKSADQVKLGDAWWDLAEKEQGKTQAALRGRAGYWYQQALPELTGLAKAKLEKRLKECEAASGASEEPKPAKGPSKLTPGLVAYYYNDIIFGTMIKARVDTHLDFDWTNDPPDPVVNRENFCVRWYGFLKVPKSGRYVIHARGHFDSQVKIDSTLVIANAVLGRHASDQQGEITLTAGYHPFVAQFVHKFGQANIDIGWQPPGATTWTAIPPENLFHNQKQEQAAGISR